MVLGIKKIIKKTVVYSLSLILISLCTMFLVQFYLGGVSFSDVLIELSGGYQYVEESNDIRVIAGPHYIDPKLFLIHLIQTIFWLQGILSQKLIHYL